MIVVGTALILASLLASAGVFSLALWGSRNK